MEQRFDKDLMPTIGEYCTMVCPDYEPPRLLSASESEEILRKTKLVYATPDDYPLPKEGHIGYVHIEKIDNNGPELKPCLFEVDVCEWEDVG